MTIAPIVSAAPAPARAVRFGRAGTVLAVLCLMYLALYVDRSNIATVGPRMAKDLHLSNTNFGLAVSAFAYPYALFQLAGGWLADRFGARRTLIACGLVVCVATVLTGFVGGLGSLIAARLALGFGEGAAFPTATRAMAVWTPPARWGFAQGITHSASRLGNAITPPLVVGLMGYASWRGAFWALGGLSLVWVALWALVSRRGPEGVVQVEAAPSGGEWLRLFRRMAPVTAVDFCYGWTLWVFLTWLQSGCLKSLHLDLAHSALFSGGVLLAGVVGDTVGGVLSDWIYRRTGSLIAARRNLIIAGLIGGFVFLIPVALTRDLPTVAVCLSLACFFVEWVVAPIWAAPMDIAPRYAATASGMMNFGFGLAGIVSPVVFGALLDLTGGWTAPFLGSVALLLVGAGLSLLMRPDRRFEG